jgi:hypothetical protein
MICNKRQYVAMIAGTDKYDLYIGSFAVVSKQGLLNINMINRFTQL